jgi:hypothetical protein
MRTSGASVVLAQKRKIILFLVLFLAANAYALELSTEDQILESPRHQNINTTNAGVSSLAILATVSGLRGSALSAAHVASEGMVLAESNDATSANGDLEDRQWQNNSHAINASAETIAASNSSSWKIDGPFKEDSSRRDLPHQNSTGREDVQSTSMTADQIDSKDSTSAIVKGDDELPGSPDQVNVSLAEPMMNSLDLRAPENVLLTPGGSSSGPLKPTSSQPGHRAFSSPLFYNSTLNSSSDLSITSASATSSSTRGSCSTRRVPSAMCLSGTPGEPTTCGAEMRGLLGLQAAPDRCLR